ncbi:hypothetical protein HDZ31DRAFT_80071 [Schizophyllum fasciatum]
MAAATLADPGAVMAAYDFVMRGDADWMLFGFAEPVNSRNEVALFAYGPGGLPELKRRMLQDPDQVLIAFFREDGSASKHPGALFINYIPPETSPGLRGRPCIPLFVIVSLHQAHQTTLTVDSLAVLTATAIAQALAAPDEPHVIELGRAAFPSDNSSGDEQHTHPHDMEPPARPSFSTQRSSPRSRSPSPPYGRSPSPGVRARTGSMFSSLLGKRRSKRRARHSEDLPPPTPPKDKDAPHRRAHTLDALQHYPAHACAHYSPPAAAEQYYAHMAASPSPPPSLPPKRASADRLSFTSDEALFVDADRVRTPTMLELPRESAAIPSAFAPPPRSSSLAHRPPVVPLPEKWAAAAVAIPDPVERARRRIETQRQRDREAAEALAQEEARQREREAARAEERRREEAEEEARRAALEREIARATAERRRREAEAREAEERAAREITERRRLDRLRRQEEHRRLEQWRTEQARAAEETRRRSEETRRSVEEARRRKIVEAEALVKTAASDALITGWVTLQTPEWPLEWRRRFYKVMGDTLFLYRSQKDMAHYLDQVYLRGKVRGLKEWNEGYEELESIPFSFAIEFKDERGSWSAFADNEDEKFKLLALLKRAAGL